jgi:hypothetical protein
MPFEEANQRSCAASSFAAAVCVVAAIALTACSSSDGVGQLLVDPSQYDVYHCKDLVAQWDQLNKREAELRANMDRASQTAGGKVIGAVAYGPDYAEEDGAAAGRRKKMRAGADLPERSNGPLIFPREHDQEK